jgi:hypothetical protein
MGLIADQAESPDDVVDIAGLAMSRQYRALADLRSAENGVRFQIAYEPSLVKGERIRSLGPIGAKLPVCKLSHQRATLASLIH